jgi:hypothetical protein
MALPPPRRSVAAERAAEEVTPQCAEEGWKFSTNPRVTRGSLELVGTPFGRCLEFSTNPRVTPRGSLELVGTPFGRCLEFSTNPRVTRGSLELVGTPFGRCLEFAGEPLLRPRRHGEGLHRLTRLEGEGDGRQVPAQARERRPDQPGSERPGRLAENGFDSRLAQPAVAQRDLRSTSVPTDCCPGLAFFRYFATSRSPTTV